MNDTESETIKFIETYANLPQCLREVYVINCPFKSRQMLDYLINITKDR